MTPSYVSSLNKDEPTFAVHPVYLKLVKWILYDTIYIYMIYLYLPNIFYTNTHTHILEFQFFTWQKHISDDRRFPFVGVLGQQLRSGTLESRQKLTASCFRTYFKEQIQVSTDKQKERYATKIVVKSRTLHSKGMGEFYSDILLMFSFLFGEILTKTQKNPVGWAAQLFGVVELRH